MNTENMCVLFEIALQKLDQSRNILLVSPESPDIDSVSCVAAFRAFLKERLGTKVKIRAYCVDSLTSLKKNTLSPFIEGGNSVRKSLPPWRPDCIVIFDYGNIERAKLPEEYNGIPIIGFDHHPRTGPAPNIELVDENLSSCTLMLYEFFLFAFYPIGGSAVAQTLLAGLVADTGRFSNSGTTSEALRAASDMDPKNEFIPEMLRASRRRIPLERLEVWQKIFPKIIFDKESGLVAMVASKKDMASWGASRRDVMTAYGIVQDIEEGRVAAAIVENDDGSWSVSLRSGPVFHTEVQKIAEEFGGGGHVYAVGFTWRGDVQVLLASLKNCILLL